MTIEKGGADGNATFGEALARFFDGDFQHLFVIGSITLTMIRHAVSSARVGDAARWLKFYPTSFRCSHHR